ncbi:MAG: thiamine monophosphate synthase [Candidatus Pelagibacter sp.]|nr:thiamine monophosphate synthase [Candidatus Pelagibacter sp.]OUV88038.1 MAG: hypothetical protein CBC96_00965 [Pelagibacteraceae bacterium TMED136]|tara:strand:- start:5539 stop:6120 length:582 start_codon:yes stop_codon:yes gene_type:complete
MFKIFFYINELNYIQKENLNQLRNINIIYRNYEGNNYYENALNLSRYCKKMNFNLYVSNDKPLATRISSYGLYIPSFNDQDYFTETNLNIIGSAHNEIEIRKKINQGCTEIFISPIFNTSSNGDKVGRGLPFYNSLIHKFSKQIRIYALGGVNQKNLNKIILSGGKGFSSKSMVEKKMKKSLISYLNLIATNL